MADIVDKWLRRGRMETKFGLLASIGEVRRIRMREKQQQKPAVYISDRSSILRPKPLTLKQKPNHQSEPDHSIGKPLFLKLHQILHQKPQSREIPTDQEKSPEDQCQRSIKQSSRRTFQKETKIS